VTLEEEKKRAFFFYVCFFSYCLSISVLCSKFQIELLVVFQEKVRHFMDNKAACEEISQELARESLICISYCLPDKVQNSEGVPQSVNDEEKLPVINGDGAEKYRSELISISDIQSPDTATSPVASENHEG
jgi:hypothetical protein